MSTKYGKERYMLKQLLQVFFRNGYTRMEAWIDCYTMWDMYDRDYTSEDHLLLTLYNRDNERTSLNLSSIFAIEIYYETSELLDMFKLQLHQRYNIRKDGVFFKQEERKRK